MAYTVQFLVAHGYLVLFLWLLAEQAALPLPSVPLLLACGALARSGELDPRLLLLCGVVACLIADNIWFQLGRRRGARVLRFICRISLEPDSCVRRTENTLLKYGLRALLVAKFVPGLNAVASPLAASSGAAWSNFLVFDTLGIIFWLLSYGFAGYLFSGQLEVAALYAMRMGSGLVVLVVALLAAWIGWKFVQRRRFLKNLATARITPNELRGMLDAGNEVLLVDLRNRLDEKAEAIPGALRISVEELAERHQEIPRDREIVLFCS